MPDITTMIRSNGRICTIRNNRDRFFYPKEWIKFNEQLRMKQLKTFDVLISTGARINEARHLKKEDVDFDNKRLILRVTKIKAAKKEKNPRPRTIPLSTQFNRRLKGYFNDKAGDDYLGILSTPAANIAMKKALQEAGITDWRMFSIHNIRKTFEIWLMALGVDGLKITAHLGHSLQVAASSYISPDIFSSEEKMMIRDILGDLYRVKY
jgi:integrase